MVRHPAVPIVCSLLGRSESNLTLLDYRFVPGSLGWLAIVVLVTYFGFWGQWNLQEHWEELVQLGLFLKIHLIHLFWPKFMEELQIEYKEKIPEPFETISQTGCPITQILTVLPTKKGILHKHNTITKTRTLIVMHCYHLILRFRKSMFRQMSQ